MNRPDRPVPARPGPSRGRYFTIVEAAEAYPIFTPRLLRRLVQERRIAFSRAGCAIVLAESDIEDYLERNRVEPPRPSRAWKSHP